MTTTSPARPDPWAPEVPTVRDERRRRGIHGPAWAALLLGASGTVAWLWRYGPEARRGAVLVGLGALAVEAALRSPPTRWRLVAAATVAALVEVVTVPLVGQTPALLMALSVLVADAAIVDWRPLPSWPARRSSTAGLALPFVVIAQIVWFRSGTLGPTVALLLCGLVVVECYHRFPAALDGADRRFRSALLHIASAAAAGILFVVALPVLYLPGGVGRLLGIGRFGRRRRAAGSTWREVELAPAVASADAGLPFISARRSTRRRRHLTGLVVIAVVVAALAVIPAVVGQTGDGDPVVRPDAAGGRDTDPQTQLDLLEFVPYSERPATAGQPFADELQRDLAAVKLVPSDATGFTTADTATTHVNVAGGERRTATVPCPGCPAMTVWLVGASAVFGVGQRDEETVASELVRLAAEEGIALKVRNLGVVGWTVNQEVTDVIARLDRGETPPDMIVVVDGFNDAVASVAAEYAGSGDDAAPLVLDQENSLAVLRSDSPLGDARIERAARRAATAYRSERGRLLAATGPRGIDVVSFFQPDAFASERQLDFVRPLYDDVPALLERTDLGDVTARTSELLSDESVDLRHVYDGLDEPIYLDMVHTNERGAAILAGDVYASIRERLRGG